MHDRSFTISLNLRLSPLAWFSVSEVVMRRIARHAAIPLFLLTVAAPIVSAQELPRTVPGTVGLSSVRLERLSNTFQGYLDTEQLAGAVILIARRGQVAYLEAFGQLDREADTPMQADGIFRIASQTKALVSVGIMMLQKEGKLLISDSVEKYLPEFKKTTVATPNPNGGYDLVNTNRAITIRDLLTHTA